MTHSRVVYVAGRYYLAPYVDLTLEPVDPADVAESGIVHWEVWADAKQDARGTWTYEWIENYDTEAEARRAAQRLADDEQFQQLQMIFNLSRMGYPATAEMVVKAAPLIEAGLVELSGDADLSIPIEVQQNLAANGRPLKLR